MGLVASFPQEASPGNKAQCSSQQGPFITPWNPTLAQPHPLPPTPHTHSPTCTPEVATTTKAGYMVCTLWVISSWFPPYSCSSSTHSAPACTARTAGWPGSGVQGPAQVSLFQKQTKGTSAGCAHAHQHILDPAWQQGKALCACSALRPVSPTRSRAATSVLASRLRPLAYTSDSPSACR